MKKEIHYTAKKNALLQEILFSVPAAILLGICLIVAVKLYDKWAVALLILFIPCYMIYLQIKSLILTLQYRRIDKNKQVIINADRTAFEILNTEKRYLIKREDIDRIEIREQKSLSKFGSYAYIIVHTNDNRAVIITDFTVPHLANDRYLEKVFAKKLRTYAKSPFNSIEIPAGHVLI